MRVASQTRGTFPFLMAWNSIASPCSNKQHVHELEHVQEVNHNGAVDEAFTDQIGMDLGSDRCRVRSVDQDPCERARTFCRFIGGERFQKSRADRSRFVESNNGMHWF